jgi:ribosomal protein L37AE/L43A
MNRAVTLPFVIPLFALVGLFGAWIYYSVRTRWSHHALADDKLYRCKGCGNVYVEARDVPMARCPQCDRFNEMVRR